MTTRKVVCLWVAPLGKREIDLTRWLAGWMTRDGRTVKRVPTARELDAESISDTADEFNAMVREELRADPDVLVVGVGHSQGCQAIGEALERWEKLPADQRPDPDRVSLLLTGNLERRHHGYIARRPKWIPAGNSKRLTPEATDYAVLDIGRRGDLWANYPGGFPSILRLTLFNPAHLDYFKVDPDKLNPLSAVAVGNTQYVNVP